MEDNISLSTAMQDTLENSNLEFLGEIGEIMIDVALNDGLLKELPVIKTIIGFGKCIRNVNDVLFAKKLIAFLIPIKDISPEERTNAIKKWQEDKDYRGKVGDTLLGMIERCDDAVKAGWLSQLFCELVLKRGWSRLFMRAEKTLSSLSVMDVQAFLNKTKDNFHRISEEESEPYIGSGLYQSPRLTGTVINGGLQMDDKYCDATEIGHLIYNILNNYPIPNVEHYK